MEKADPVIVNSNRKPLIKAGWLRAVIFIVVYSGLLLGVLYLFRAAAKNIQLPVLANFGVSLLCVVAFRIFLDRKSIRSLGLDFHWRSIGGILLAIFLLGAGTLVLYYSGRLAWTDILFDGNGLMLGLGFMIFIAVAEELVFRGYLLTNFLESMNPWVAIGLQALIFMLFHLGNQGIATIPFVNIFLAGIILGLARYLTRSLWFPLFFHLGWNFFQGPLLGYNISGYPFQSLLQIEMKGDELLTGGSFGFEGSLLATAGLLLGGGLLYLLLTGNMRLTKRSLPVQGQK